VGLLGLLVYYLLLLVVKGVQRVVWRSAVVGTTATLSCLLLSLLRNHCKQVLGVLLPFKRILLLDVRCEIGVKVGVSLQDVGLLRCKLSRCSRVLWLVSSSLILRIVAY
jgi:hypothetical protein